MQKKVIFRYTRTILLLIALSLLGQMILPMLYLPMGVSATPIKKVIAFSDGSQYKDITLNANGIDSSSAKLSFQTGVAVKNTSFSVDGQPNIGSFPSNITIDVGNNGQPDWQWQGLGYGALGHQNLFILNGKQNGSANLSIMGGGGNNDTASIRLPFGAQVTNATMLVTVKGVSIAIECKTGSRACNTVDNDPVYSMRDVFKEKGWSVKIVTGTDIDSVAKLSQFTVVVMGDALSNDNDHSTFQTPLRTWVTQYGGGMIGTGWILYSTSAGTDKDFLLPVSGGWTWSNGQVTITNPNHPVTQGVNNFNTPAGSYCEYPSNGAVDAGAISLGTCSGPTIVVSQKGAGRTMYLGPVLFDDFQTRPASKNWYNDANLKRLLQQAALWASGGGSLSGYIDVGNDSTKEWSKTNYNGSGGMADFSSSLNTYMATVANPTYVDSYGNKFVDIPIRVNATSAGLISMSNLTINYTYTARVDINPHNGSLANEINGIIPAAVGPKNITIPIAVSSDTAGIVKLHNFNADLIDPPHAPLITDYTPTEDLIEIDENKTADFKVSSMDWYRYPLTPTWFVDNKKNITGDTFSYFSTFESSGDHNITVVVNNTMQSAQRSWTVRVHNVDRPPRIISYSPDLKVTMSENESKTFTVVAKDPDIGDPVGYTWTLDKNAIGSASPTFDYKPTYYDQGQHTIEVTARDPKGLTAAVTWDVTVQDANAPPEIYFWSPKGDPTTSENSTLSFAIKAKTLDEDTLTFSWSINGKTVPNEVTQTFKYSPGFEDSGTRLVQVDVSDGQITVSHKWTVTVSDVNRPPTAVIFSPHNNDEFLTTDNITFSAKGSSDPDKDSLTYDWYEGNVKIGTGLTMVTKLPKAIQTVELRVSDGKDGLTTAEVKIIVRSLRFDITVDTDSSAPKTGDTIKFNVQIKSIGDADGTNVPVYLYVDGVRVSNKTIPTISSGDTQNLVFDWTATEGTHTVSVGILQDSGQKTISVQKPLIPVVGGKGNTWLLPMILIIVVVAVLVGAVAAVMSRKKKATLKAQQAAAAAAAPAAPSAPVQPVQTAPSSPYRLVPPPTPTVPPPATYQAPQVQGPQMTGPQMGYYQQPATSPVAVGMPMPLIPQPYNEPERTIPEQPSLTADVGAGIESELQSTEAAISNAESSGRDMNRAKNQLKLARFFASKGDQAKAMDYCKKAREAAK